MPLKTRPRLSARTTGLLYHLQRAGSGGADATALARSSRMPPRNAAARLRWLARVGLVRYVHDTERWQLTDDSLFIKESP